MYTHRYYTCSYMCICMHVYVIWVIYIWVNGGRELFNFPQAQQNQSLVWAYLYVWIYTYAYMRIYIRVHVCRYTHYIDTCIYVNGYIYVHVRVYIFKWFRAFVCIHVFTLYIHILYVLPVSGCNNLCLCVLVCVFVCRCTLWGGYSE